MSDMKHTSEPWEIHKTHMHGISNGYQITDKRNVPIAQIYVRSWPDEKAELNARRIVACVNACAGWTIKELELYQESGIRTYSFETVRAISAHRDHLEAEVARLRGVLRDIAEGYWTDSCSQRIAERALATRQEEEGK